MRTSIMVSASLASERPAKDFVTRLDPAAVGPAEDQDVAGVLFDVADLGQHAR